MKDLMLSVPTFPRLDEYVGLWCIEPERAARLLDLAQRMDFARHIAAAAPPPPRAAIEKLPAANGQSVAVVKLTGVLMKQASSMGGTSTIQARRDIRQAAADPNVAGILLAVDSPGGTAAGTDDLAAEVRQARKSKPVWAHIDDLGASAAYWVASQAERVFANSATALVGSIGTVMTVYDLSAAAEQQGVKALVFATGPIKGAGTPGSKVTEEQQAYFQRIVNETQLAFDTAVMKGRGLNAAQLADVRSGEVFTAPTAVGRKLIDAVQPLSKTIDEMTRAVKARAMAAGSSRSGPSTAGRRPNP